MVDVKVLLIYFVIILVSVSIHEAAHAFTSYFLGDDTAKLQGRLSFNPLKHIDPFMSLIMPMMLAVVGLPVFGGAKPVKVNQLKIKWGDYGMALVALAGPLSNFMQAFLAYGIMVIASSDGVQNMAVALVSYIAVQVNLGFMLFNLIPIPPLDGSRVLYALVPESIKKVMYLIEKNGIWIIMFLVIVANDVLAFYVLKMSSVIQAFFATIFGLFN